MSLKRDFYTVLGELARDPDGAAVVGWAIDQIEPVLVAYEAGDHDRAAELIGDLQAKALLAQALPGWAWGGGDGGGPGPMELSP